MKIDTLNEANRIASLIEKNKGAIKELERFSGSGVTLFVNQEQCYMAPCSVVGGIYFDDSEVKMIVDKKKEKVKELEQKLENL